MLFRQRCPINPLPNDKLGGCDDSTNQIHLKKVSLPNSIVFYGRGTFCWLWLFGHAGHMPSGCDIGIMTAWTFG